MGLYLRKLDGSPAVRLGEGNAVGFSPDGRWALSIKELENGQFTLLPTGAGEPKELAKTGISINSATYFPDGKRILITGNEPGHGVRLFVQDIAGGKPRAISPEGVSFIFPTISPDGKSVVATGPDRRLAIYPIEPGEPRPLPGPGSRGRSVAMDARRDRDLRLPPVRAAAARRDDRRQDRQTRALEGAPAARSVRRRAGRPDPDLAGREVLRVFLPPRARRAAYLATGLRWSA